MSRPLRNIETISRPHAPLGATWMRACLLAMLLLCMVSWTRAMAAAPPTGDQQRQYVFPPTGQAIPYRIYVPTKWDGRTSLPIILFLHGAGANERTYLDMADGQVRKLAEEHGYIVVSPLGFTPMGAFGNPLRLPAVYGQNEAADQQRAAITPERRRELALSELDVITVLDIVTEEYGADRSRTYLAGHSMGSGGAWHLAARYPERWRAVAPMSGPFIDARHYPFSLLRDMPILITEGTQGTPSLEGSRKLAEFLRKENYRVEYLEVDGNHGSMVPMVWPRVFEFFNEVVSPTGAAR
jgi:predicted peptidase